MGFLYAANLVVLLVAAWAVWARRLTFRSRWDSSITYGIVLFGMGAALDSPWPGVATASYSLTGKYYLLMFVGQVCSLSGGAMGIRDLYQRLLPDNALEPFMRNWIAPMIGAASVVMLICLLSSPVTSTMPAQHLYLVRPDGWLTVYWIAFVGVFFALAVIAMFGANRLRADPRSVTATRQLLCLAVGSLAIVLVGFGIVTHRPEIPLLLVWPCAYAAIIGGAITAVTSWRHRLSSLFSSHDAWSR
ncbi:MAG: hypothetical protein FGM52_04570 [Mycobacterium sp.]|nr:hypothetical protein [Mycobacterium sp.]